PGDNTLIFSVECDCLHGQIAELAKLPTVSFVQRKQQLPVKAGYINTTSRGLRNTIQSFCCFRERMVLPGVAAIAGYERIGTIKTVAAHHKAELTVTGKKDPVEAAVGM